jgi:hypothetical protein
MRFEHVETNTFGRSKGDRAVITDVRPLSLSFHSYSLSLSLSALFLNFHSHSLILSLSLSLSLIFVCLSGVIWCSPGWGRERCETPASLHRPDMEKADSFLGSSCLLPVQSDGAVSIPMPDKIQLNKLQRGK